MRSQRASDMQEIDAQMASGLFKVTNALFTPIRVPPAEEGLEGIQELWKPARERLFSKVEG